jgi:hypothetical protein
MGSKQQASVAYWQSTRATCCSMAAHGSQRRALRWLRNHSQERLSLGYGYDVLEESWTGW